CGADRNKLSSAALDDLCLITFRERLTKDIENRQINAIDRDGNVSNDGRWAGYRLSPQLKLVRKNVREGDKLSLRSLMLYGHDAIGNVTTMVDFGDVRNFADTQDDARDDYRVDIAYKPVTPRLEKINSALQGKVAAADVLDRPSELVVRQGAK